MGGVQESGHDLRVHNSHDNFGRLWDTYRFPGFLPDTNVTKHKTQVARSIQFAAAIPSAVIAGFTAVGKKLFVRHAWSNPIVPVTNQIQDAVRDLSCGDKNPHLS